MKPVLLDLFAGGGGASMGYHRAGFEVVGVDIKRYRRYPFRFIEADITALDVPWLAAKINAVAVHASPPCLAFTAYRRREGVGDDAENLIPFTREVLMDLGLPYVIENVEQAKDELINPIRLCGSSFGLDVQRHRLFESNIPLTGKRCNHSRWAPRFTPAGNRTNPRKTVEIGAGRIPMTVQSAAMDIDWMSRRALSQAIPPAYTLFLGRQLMAHLTGSGVVI